MQTLKIALWRTILGLTIELHELAEILAIDATVVDRVADSQHYAHHIKNTFRAFKRRF